MYVSTIHDPVLHFVCSKISNVFRIFGEVKYNNPVLQCGFYTKDTKIMVRLILIFNTLIM